MSKYDMANMFKVFEQSNGNLVYNIMNSIYINSGTISREYYEDYIVRTDDTWTLISYMNYGTIELWWLICKFNQISSPIDMPEVGSILKIPTQNVVEQIINGL